MNNKYIEELTFGDCFIFEDDYYVLSIDYKKDGSRYCVSLKDGGPRWFKQDNIVEKIQIYTMDKDNNIIPLKETPKDANIKTQNIS